MLLVTRSWAPPALDAAVSEVLLRRSPDGEAVLRLFVPDRAVVFGRQDRARPGFRAAVDAAMRAGYAPVMRLAGGRAAVFHEGTVALALSAPEPAPRETIADRFRFVSGAIADALRSTGVDARVGEVPGEYCPGAYSVNVGGTHKVAGIGQRLIAGGAHVGGVIVVSGPEAINEVLGPVYRSLGYDWDPAATGSLSQRVDASPADVIDAVAAALAHGDVARGEPPREVIDAAGEHAQRFDLAIA